MADNRTAKGQPMARGATPSHTGNPKKEIAGACSWVEREVEPREPEVRRVSGLSRTTRWRKVKKGTFPRPHKISDNAVAWLASDVFRWRDMHSGKHPDAA